MKNNDFLRRFRYAIDLKDKTMIEIFKLSGLSLTKDEINMFLKKEEEENFKKLSNENLIKFLDGFIIYKRGLQENKQEVKEIKITKNNLNNIILRKIKIAFSYRSEDMLELFKLGGQEISKGALSALFRAEDHKNYKECGDKFIRVFIKGMTEKYRN